MSKKKVGDIVAEFLEDFLKENDLELFNVEFVKEGKDRYLRVYIDKPYVPGQEEKYVDVSECELVSRFLSEKLDEEDPIAENYILEVSSPGMDRPLIHDKDFERFRGSMVDVSLYKASEYGKQFSMILEGRRDGCILLKDSKGADVSLPEDQVSKIRLSVIF